MSRHLDTDAGCVVGDLYFARRERRQWRCKRERALGPCPMPSLLCYSLSATLYATDGKLFYFCHQLILRLVGHFRQTIKRALHIGPLHDLVESLGSGIAHSLVGDQLRFVGTEG